MEILKKGKNNNKRKINIKIKLNKKKTQRHYITNSIHNQRLNISNKKNNNYIFSYNKHSRIIINYKNHYLKMKIF